MTFMARKRPFFRKCIYPGVIVGSGKCVDVLDNVLLLVKCFLNHEAVVLDGGNIFALGEQRTMQ